MSKAPFEGWDMVQLPHQIVVDMRVPHPEVRLFAYLTIELGRGETPTLTGMARAFGTNIRVIKRWLRKLQECGYLEISGSGRNIRYTLIAKPEIDEESEPRPVPTSEAHQAMVRGLAMTCQINLSTASKRTLGQLHNAARVLREAGAIPEDLVLFGRWWYEEDWRGKKGNAPVPAQVRSEWGQAMAWADAKEAGLTELKVY